MKKNRKLLSALALYIMLALALLLVTLFGAKLYQKITDSQHKNEQLRATLAYVQSRVAAADAENGVLVRTAPEGQALVLRQKNAGYEVCIYLYGGSLMEQTAPIGSGYTPDAAQKIADCTEFDVQLDGNLLTFTADGRTALASIRTGQEGKA